MIYDVWSLDIHGGSKVASSRGNRYGMASGLAGSESTMVSNQLGRQHSHALLQKMH